MHTLSVRFRWPGLRSAKFEIRSDSGQRYECVCQRDLSFSVVVGSTKMIDAHVQQVEDHRSILRIQGLEVPVTIQPGIRGVSADTIIRGDERLKLPTLFHPEIPSLGLRFSWLGLLGLGYPSVKVAENGDERLAVAILAYLAARSIFVDG